MAHRVARLAVGTVLACTFVAALAAQDLAGSRDHALVKRMAGSQIVMYSAKDFDEYYLFCGVPPAKAAVNIAQSKDVQHVEGKLTRIRYKLPSGTSTLEGIRRRRRLREAVSTSSRRTARPRSTSGGWRAR